MTDEKDIKAETSADTPKEEAKKVEATETSDAAAGATSESEEKPKPKPKPKKKPKGPAIENLVVSSSPHLLTQDNVHKIMHNVILSLIPAVIGSVYFFGAKAAILILFCVVTCLLTEYALQKLNNKKIQISDGSAVITGLLLALTLPPAFPLTLAFIGSVFSIAIGKFIFGGLGFNIFNPALLGRAFLQAAFPVQITTWTDPLQKAGVDVIAQATPLAMVKFESSFADHMDMLIGNVGGSLGETSVILLLIGGLFLRYKGYVNWKMPLGFLGSIFVFSGIFWLTNPEKFADPLYHILAGGAMLGAWFMVTDMVSSPITPRGQWIFVIMAGFITVIIRLFGGLPEGVMYSILLMNSAVPLIDKWTRPKVFGEIIREEA